MRTLFAAATSPFDIKAAFLAGHAQYPVIIQFLIALFIASVVFDVLTIAPGLGARRLRAKNNSARSAYFASAGLGLMAITLTGPSWWNPQRP